MNIQKLIDKHENAKDATKVFLKNPKAIIAKHDLVISVLKTLQKEQREWVENCHKMTMAGLSAGFKVIDVEDLLEAFGLDND